MRKGDLTQAYDSPKNSTRYILASWLREICGSSWKQARTTLKKKTLGQGKLLNINIKMRYVFVLAGNYCYVVHILVLPHN